MSDFRLLLARVALASLTTGDPVNPPAGDRPTRTPVDVLAEQLLSSRTSDPFAELDATYRAAEHTVAQTAACGGRIVTPEDEEWPATLAGLPDGVRPWCLWVRGGGHLRQLAERSVTITGSRAATSYGVHVATELAQTVASDGVTVFAGASFGIDAAAHRGALGVDEPTVAVLASGIAVTYPLAHGPLLDAIARTGVLVSPFPPDSTPHRARFAVRNNLLAEITGATLLVEASLRSSSRSTIGRARDLGRPAMAVPGPITSVVSLGCHAELKVAGTILVDSADDITRALATRTTAAAPSTSEEI